MRDNKKAGNLARVAAGRKHQSSQISWRISPRTKQQLSQQSAIWVGRFYGPASRAGELFRLFMVGAAVSYLLSAMPARALDQSGQNAVPNVKKNTSGFFMRGEGLAVFLPANGKEKNLTAMGVGGGAALYAGFNISNLKLEIGAEYMLGSHGTAILASDLIAAKNVQANFTPSIDSGTIATGTPHVLYNAPVKLLAPLVITRINDPAVHYVYKSSIYDTTGFFHGDRGTITLPAGTVIYGFYCYKGTQIGCATNGVTLTNTAVAYTTSGDKLTIKNIDKNEWFLPMVASVGYSINLLPGLSLTPAVGAGMMVHHVNNTINSNSNGADYQLVDKATNIKPVVVPKLGLDIAMDDNATIGLNAKIYFVPGGYSDAYSSAARQLINSTNNDKLLWLGSVGASYQYRF
ncbi:MAG: hypothetical protein ORN57_05340 [Alphaproteobacteria bacterium]|nr:hypothetical protein [Alphaproteobacteria bacterium]